LEQIGLLEQTGEGMAKFVAAHLIVGCLVALSAAHSALAQLAAFPGAEGAGKYAVGGRNGDVYVVNNLNNSGTGSLRYAIDTAPATGRTIVFSVGGTIDLSSDIIVDSPNITIAGQTAPGGITLTHRQFRINNTHDVILQHIRVRPGDFYTKTNGGDSFYEPDGIWVSGSNKVMVDHVTASWSTDEALSVTHGSTNVTVQWSLMTEALNDSYHGDGEGGFETHAYGSIIHGGETTLHHNLYANNRSRNPATGNWDKTAPITPAHLDIVNNVISNPGDRYSYSGGDDQYEVNWTGNYGIEGPNTTRENELFHPDNVNSFVYYAGNYYDTNEDGILQLTPASPATLTGNYTALASPVATTNPPIQTSAPTAYMQVLSYAGAARSRDPIDKRVINGVINQNGAIIDSQDQVGGWYYPTPTSIALDPDGLPDSWKVSHGLDPNDNTIGRQQPVPGGYTYLEMYLHELNAPYQPPTATHEITVSTAFGNGADATLSENGGVAGGDGSGGSLAARWNNSNLNEFFELRFDLSQIERGQVADATLELTAFQSLSNQTLRVYGVEHSVGNQDWDESTAAFDNAPGLVFDGNSTTRGRVAGDLLLLGELNTGTKSEGDTVSFANPDLTTFLNLLAYRTEGPADVVTLLVERQNTSSTQSLFASREATQLATGFAAAAGTYAPRLLLQSVLVPAPILAGDYNDDGQVDAADYTVWRDSLSTGTPLMNETASPGTVDAEDYEAWKANFGAPGTNGSGQQSNVPVPEPATCVLVLAAALALPRWRRR
jgi:hypothetical protein